MLLILILATSNQTRINAHSSDLTSYTEKEYYLSYSDESEKVLKKVDYQSFSMMEEIKEDVDPSLSPSNPAFCGFLMMVFDEAWGK